MKESFIISSLLGFVILVGACSSEVRQPTPKLEGQYRVTGIDWPRPESSDEQSLALVALAATNSLPAHIAVAGNRVTFTSAGGEVLETGQLTPADEGKTLVRLGDGKSAEFRTARDGRVTLAAGTWAYQLEAEPRGEVAPPVR